MKIVEPIVVFSVASLVFYGAIYFFGPHIGIGVGFHLSGIISLLVVDLIRWREPTVPGFFIPLAFQYVVFAIFFFLLPPETSFDVFSKAILVCFLSLTIGYVIVHRKKS